MSRLIWSPSALLDIQRLYKFLSEKNTDAARKAVKTIREGVNIIVMQPAIGRPVAEMEPEFREWFIDFGGSGYVVLYHLNEKEAIILAVRHQREAGWD